MTFTTGGLTAFERMMRSVPCFDKSPLPFSELQPACARCVHFCPDARRCRFCRCPMEEDGTLFCGN